MSLLLANNGVIERAHPKETPKCRDGVVLPGTRTLYTKLNMGNP